MQKSILIISSNVTGHGHKSITDSLLEEFCPYTDFKVTDVDGFSLAGNFGLSVGKMYGSVTRKAQDIWKLIWEVSRKKTKIVNDLTEINIRDNFLKLLHTVKPNLIVSVHPAFNGSILNILKKSRIKVPFVTVLADIISISPLWMDKRADFIICPTIEAKERCLEYGISESKLIYSGFPVRKKFLPDNELENLYSIDRPLECLIMSGGEGSGDMISIAKTILNNFNSNVTIIAGRNKRLKLKIEKDLSEKYGNNINIYGFTDKVEKLMKSSDIAFTRGSPNVMMEAIMCNVPLVITEALPGQEAENPYLIKKHNLGIILKENADVKSAIEMLLMNNSEKLNSIKKSQREYRTPAAAKNIVDFLCSLDLSKNIILPDKFPVLWNVRRQIKMTRAKIKRKTKL